MVSSTLMMQELVSKKGDMNTLDDIVADQTESESNTDCQRHPIETEPAKLISGDQDEVLEEEREHLETHGNSDGTPRVKGKPKQSTGGNDYSKNLG